MYKYADAAASLLAEKIIGQEDLIDPGLATWEDILRVHTQTYLDSLVSGRMEAQALRRLGYPWSDRLLPRSRTAVAGTIAAVQSAIKYGIASNLAGGTHHSFPDRGEGYCVLNDVAVAIRKLQFEQPGIRVLIVDLDAHQGNGSNFIFRDDPSVFTFSMHVAANYPSRKYEGRLDVGFERWVEGEKYLADLYAILPRLLDDFAPDLAIYLAGVDVHKDDRFGQMKLESTDMFERDRFTIETLRARNLPVATVFGGGYNKVRAMTPWLHCQTVRIAAGYGAVA